MDKTLPKSAGDAVFLRRAVPPRSRKAPERGGKVDPRGTRLNLFQSVDRVRPAAAGGFSSRRLAIGNTARLTFSSSRQAAQRRCRAAGNHRSFWVNSAVVFAKLGVMKSLFSVAWLLVGCAVMAAAEAPKPAARLQAISIREVPLRQGERIAGLEVEVTGGEFRDVRIPTDWGVEIEAPVSGVSVMKGTAAHGVGMLSGTSEFGRFATVACRDSGESGPALSVKAKLALHRHDPATGQESERPLDVPGECVLLADPAAPAGAKSPDPGLAVEAAFAELRELAPMREGQRYTIEVGGRIETGSGDDFLRRRTAEEIKDSGLSCGCGDHAIVFINAMAGRGFSTLFVDSAEISCASLESHFSGHAVVAIRPPQAAPDAPWWLVDSTALRIISRNWQPTARSFQTASGIYWIGYCGPLNKYPVHDPEALRAFYARTLAGVPREFLARSLVRIEFSVDPSLRDPRGGFLNPRLAEFLDLPSRILASYGVEPARKIRVLLVRGQDDYRSDLEHSDSGGWVCHLGLRSGCTRGLLEYFECVVRNDSMPPR